MLEGLFCGKSSNGSKSYNITAIFRVFTTTPQKASLSPELFLSCDFLKEFRSRNFFRSNSGETATGVVAAGGHFAAAGRSGARLGLRLSLQR
jgi:hypothetical protein